MYDKRVRRRRAVLALLVVLSLVLLTASFGSSGGALGGLQSGVQAVFSPIEEGASKAFKPVRDLFGWFGDTFHAKSRLEQATKEIHQLRREVVGATIAQQQNVELRHLVELDSNAGLDRYSPVAANIIGRSPTVWYSTVRIDKGSSDGLEEGQPVVADGGLVGKLTDVSSGSSSVTLITDHTSNVQAQVADTRDYGVIQPDVGNPNDLQMKYLDPHSKVKKGDRIVTSGTIPDPNHAGSEPPSLFPPGIQIGYVTSVDTSGGGVAPTVHVHPYADLRRFGVVQVLTQNVPGDRAQVGG